MCGICGAIDFVHQGVDPRSIQRMCEALAHRGPDDKGMVFFDGNGASELDGCTALPTGKNGFHVGLGHRRLSIIDLSRAAHQPMGNEDKTVWIVYNGEIYNFQNLRQELEGKGHIFRSQSDTEVILHAYEEWDIGCLERLRGMFALAIWNERKRRLFLARDRLGKKPLVYYAQNGRFLFASEMNAIFQTRYVERKVNPEALNHYLTFQYVPSPNTILEGLRKLPPAHYLLYDGSGKVRVERYWKFRFPASQRPASDIQGSCELIRRELEESVRLRMISDVPLGAFLSGGIDSSIVVGIMANQSRKPVQTFSIGFEERGFDELPYARLVSKHFGTEHHEFMVRPKATEILPKLVWHFGEPFADSSCLPTYYVANLTKNYVKVVLTGDAGDENFAGYRRYVWTKWLSLLVKCPKKLRRQYLTSLLRTIPGFLGIGQRFHRMADIVESLSADEAKNYGELIKIFNTREKEALYTGDFLGTVKGTDPFSLLSAKYEEVGIQDALDRLLYVDIHTYLPEDLLVKLDISSMANSLEARIPFLDHQLMEAVAGIPSALKLKGLTTKFILKRAFADLIPEPILRRQKMGFAVPVGRWFRKELKEYVMNILLDRRTLNRGYFRREGLEGLITEHHRQLYDHSAKIWALLVLELWFRIFIDGEEGLVAEAA